MRILQTLLETEVAEGKPAFYVQGGRAYAVCGQGLLRIVRFELDGREISASEFAGQFGTQKFEFNC